MNRAIRFFPLIIFLFSLFSACSAPIARTVAVIPRPEKEEHQYIPSLSKVAAERVVKEIGEKGYAAILPESKARPDSCYIAEKEDASADLLLYVWVQVVDLPLPEYPSEKPRTWGGLAIRDDDGRELANTKFLRQSPDKPSNAFYAVASPEDPEAIKAADAFGAYLIGSPGRFAGKLNEIFGGTEGEKDAKKIEEGPSN